MLERFRPRVTPESAQVMELSKVALLRVLRNEDDKQVKPDELDNVVAFLKGAFEQAELDISASFEEDECSIVVSMDYSGNDKNAQSYILKLPVTGEKLSSKELSSLKNFTLWQLSDSKEELSGLAEEIITTLEDEDLIQEISPQVSSEKINIQPMIARGVSQPESGIVISSGKSTIVPTDSLSSVNGSDLPVSTYISSHMGATILPLVKSKSELDDRELGYALRLEQIRTEQQYVRELVETFVRDKFGLIFAVAVGLVDGAAEGVANAIAEAFETSAYLLHRTLVKTREGWERGARPTFDEGSKDQIFHPKAFSPDNDTSVRIPGSNFFGRNNGGKK